MIEKKGNTYNYQDERLGVGRENAKNYLRENPKLMQKVKTEIWTKYNETQNPKPTDKAEGKINK